MKKEPEYYIKIPVSSLSEAEEMQLILKSNYGGFDVLIMEE